MSAAGDGEKYRIQKYGARPNSLRADT